MNDYRKAITDLTEAIRIDPRYERAYALRGLAWLLEKEDDKAIADFTEVIRINPRDVDAYTVRADAWDHKKEYDKAIADYTEVIRIEPHDFDDFSTYVGAYTSRASTWAKKKEYSKAIADNTEAISIRPKSPLAYNNRAWIWATCPDEKYREGKKAVESATKACELTEWHDPQYMDTLAAAYAEASDFASAVKWQTNANELRDGPVGPSTRRSAAQTLPGEKGLPRRAAVIRACAIHVSVSVFVGCGQPLAMD